MGHPSRGKSSPIQPEVAVELQPVVPISPLLDPGYTRLPQSVIQDAISEAFTSSFFFPERTSSKISWDLLRTEHLGKLQEHIAGTRVIDIGCGDKAEYFADRLFELGIEQYDGVEPAVFPSIRDQFRITQMDKQRNANLWLYDAVSYLEEQPSDSANVINKEWLMVFS